MAKRCSWCLFVSEANVCVGATATWVGCAAAFHSCGRTALLRASAHGYRTRRQRAGAPCVSRSHHRPPTCLWRGVSAPAPAWGYAWPALGRNWPLQPVLDVAF